METGLNEKYGWDWNYTYQTIPFLLSKFAKEEDDGLNWKENLKRELGEVKLTQKLKELEKRYLEDKEDRERLAKEKKAKKEKEKRRKAEERERFSFHEIVEKRIIERLSK